MLVIKAADPRGAGLVMIAQTLTRPVIAQAIVPPGPRHPPYPVPGARYATSGMKVTSGKNAGGRTVPPAVPPTIPSAHVTENSSEVIMADACQS